MQASNKAIALIKEFEGFKANAYLCPAGVWTIGYGTTKGVKPGMAVTKMQAEMMLENDLKRAETQLTAMLLRVNQNQFDALVSLLYNIGIGNFRSSTLLRLVRINPNDLNIADEFKKWRMAAGRVLPGLERRRAAEAALYFAK